MHNKQSLTELGTRIKVLRKKRGWTQKELANKVSVQYPQLNKYEGGLHAPPVDKLIKLAHALDTSVDYLLTGKSFGNVSLQNTKLLTRFNTIQNIPLEDQETVIKLMDAMIVKNRVEGVLKIED